MTGTAATQDNAIEEQRWQQLNNPHPNDTFFYAVITTGIYCRPGCPSRKPKRDNVRFFNAASDAELAGFRPCKRCHPHAATADSRITERIARLCRLIETAPDEPSLAELAEFAGISSYHLQRQFNAVTGISPKAYAKAHRTINEPSMPDSNKTNETINYTCGSSSLGFFLIAQSPQGVCAILLGDNQAALIAELNARFPKAKLQQNDQDFSKSLQQLINMIEQPSQSIHLPLDIRGTLFQQRVWKLLQEIPAGETRTYTEIAQALGSPKAVRAVASACAANALAIAIPCHRVVRSNGSLAGYRWGLERKKSLLQREKATE